MAPRQRNLLVGSVVVVALVALGWMILMFSSRSAASLFNKGTNVHLVSDRVDGVSEGSPVLYLGVNVGRVMAVRRVPGQPGAKPQVAVDIIIDAKDPLPKNLVGVIRQQSPLSSSAAINLELDGAPAAENLADGAQLRATFQGGGVVPPEFGQLAADLREQHLIEHVDQAVVSIRTQVEKTGQVLDRVNGIAGDPKVHEDLRATIANVRQTSENFQKFSARLDELSGETKATLAQVRTTVGDTGRSVDTLSRDVGERLHQVGDILGKFQSVANKIDKGDGAAGQFVNDPRLYESLVDTSRELNETVKTLKRLGEQWEQEGVSLKLK